MSVWCMFAHSSTTKCRRNTLRFWQESCPCHDYIPHQFQAHCIRQACHWWIQWKDPSHTTSKLVFFLLFFFVKSSLQCATEIINLIDWLMMVTGWLPLWLKIIHVFRTGRPMLTWYTDEVYDDPHYRRARWHQRKRSKGHVTSRRRFDAYYAHNSTTKKRRSTESFPCHGWHSALLPSQKVTRPLWVDVQVTTCRRGISWLPHRPLLLLLLLLLLFLLYPRYYRYRGLKAKQFKSWSSAEGRHHFQTTHAARWR